MMDIKKIKRVIELIENTSISEIEIKEGEASLRLSRHEMQASRSAINHEKHNPVASSSFPSELVSEPTSSAESAPTSSALGQAIRSPMVGTFYAASSPENPPFVQIGQMVNAGQVLCTIEAMKMFNEVESDRAGKVIEILVKNGEPVEYDQPLFIIE